MIKGCERKIILIQGGECAPFESAYFVIKKGADDVGEKDMVREAKKIVDRALPEKIARTQKRKKIFARLKNAFLFFAGVAVGALLSFMPLLVASLY